MHAVKVHFKIYFDKEYFNILLTFNVNGGEGGVYVALVCRLPNVCDRNVQPQITNISIKNEEDIRF